MSLMKHADITIITAPAEVLYKCPYCGEEVEVPYKDFTEIQTEHEWDKWDEISCDACSKVIAIDQIKVE